MDVHIAAAHKYRLKEWAAATGFAYLSASNKEELEGVMDDFISADGETPKLLEVFTDLHFDGEYCLDVYKYLEKEISPVIESIKR